MREDYGFGYPAALEYWYQYPPDILGPTRFNPVPPPPPPPENEKDNRKVGYKDGEQRPVSRPPLLAPIPPQLPPKHTQVQPRCFTCKHFEMCGFKKDYLKTVTLVQNSLGAPQADYELTNNYITIPRFVGFPLVNQDEYLPKEVTFDNSDHVGKLWLAKFNGINYVNIIYKDTKYYILIELKYNKETELYELKSCKEAFYKVDYELNEKSLEEIQLKLIDWREIIINAKAPPPPPRKDIINTTHFSATLNCDMYDWNKESFEDAMRRLIKKYPNGVPISEDDRFLYHIATYHIANGEVPYAPLFYGQKDKHCVNYVPPQPAGKPPRPPKRRGDM